MKLKTKKKTLLIISTIVFLSIVSIKGFTASEKYQFLKTGMVNVLDFGVIPNDSIDDTKKIQDAIDYVMMNGGGTVYFPAGDYEINGTLYTHSDSFDKDADNSPLELRGETPINSDLYNSKSKNVTRLIKRNEGVIIGVNYTPTKETVISSVYRNFSVRNIGFYGSGTLDDTYKKVFKSTKETIGIEVRNAGITVEDSIFWTLYKGISQPNKVNDVDNYSDQNVYRHLGFYNIGHTWIELQRSDATTIEHINGYNMARNSLYGIHARKGESFSIKEILVAGKAMHLSKDFKLVYLDHTNNVSISSLYAERVEGNLVYLKDSTNVSINGLSVRHYGNTYVKGENVKNISISNVYSHIEEGMILSSEDIGDYTTYTKTSIPNDFSFDENSSNITFRSTVFANGIHQEGKDFTETSKRFFPLVNKSSISIHGDDTYNFTFFYDATTKKIVGKMNGKIVDTEKDFGFTTTYNESLGIMKFSKTGLLSNIPSILVSNRVAPDGTINYPSIMSNDPLQIKLLNEKNSLIPLSSVSFSININY
jgi:hypothetical protein